MKLRDPIIIIPHKVEGQFARSTFTFTGLVDKRRVRREIIKRFRTAGEVVSPVYINACIDASLRFAHRVATEATIEDMLAAQAFVEAEAAEQEAEDACSTQTENNGSISGQETTV